MAERSHDAPWLRDAGVAGIREIDRAASQIELHGARYPDHLQKLVGR